MSSRPETISITAHCLLRYTVALMLESKGLDHSYPSATAELNRLAGRSHTARQWFQILDPYYQRRFGGISDP